MYDPDPERVAAMPVPVTGHPSVQAAVAGADVVVTLAPIVQPPAPTLRRAWLGDRFLALPADFNASFLADVSEDADLFLADDIGQYRYYQGRASSAAGACRSARPARRWTRPAPPPAWCAATSASARWTRRSPTPCCRPRPAPTSGIRLPV